MIERESSYRDIALLAVDKMKSNARCADDKKDAGKVERLITIEDGLLAHEADLEALHDEKTELFGPESDVEAFQIGNPPAERLYPGKVIPASPKAGTLHRMPHLPGKEHYERICQVLPDAWQTWMGLGTDLVTIRFYWDAHSHVSEYKSLLVEASGVHKDMVGRPNEFSGLDDFDVWRDGKVITVTLSRGGSEMVRIHLPQGLAGIVAGGILNAEAEGRKG